MIRKLAIWTLLLSVVAATPLLAQEYRGNLYLTVTTEDGQPLIGAKVTVGGIGASRTSETNDRGEVRFIKLEPGRYDVTVEKDGFNTVVQKGVVINTNANTDMSTALQRTEVVETVEVQARTPVMDKRKTGTATVLNPEEINQIPSARDPWAVLATVPGIQTDRINVGGNQSGQQSTFVGKGDDGDNATWVMDGVEFTDLAAEGGSSTYFDWNSFNEIGFTTGGGDFEKQTGGQRLNFTTKQGTNTTSGSIGLVFADRAFQSSGFKGTQPEGDPVEGNKIAEVFEKNFELGGPIVEDKAWYWFGFSQNDIDNRLPGGAGGTLLTDRTKLQNVTAKVNANFGGQTTVKGFYTRGDKIKIGRNAGPDRPQPTSWDQSGPTPIYTFDVSHFFNENFEIAGQYSHVGGGFQLIPQASANQIRWDSGLIWQDTFIDYVTERPQDQFAVRGNWFGDTGSVGHEVKFGFKYKEGEVQSFSTYGTQGVVAVEWLGEAWLYRQGTAKEDMKYTSVWVGDTILAGNWTVNVGALYTQQSGTQLGSNSPANGLCPSCLNALSFGSFDPNFEWTDIMPRVGASYSFDTAMRQVVRLQYGQYVDQLAVNEIAYNHPMNVAEIDYGWTDLNGNQLVEMGEFDSNCVTGPIFVSNTTPCATGTVFQPDLIDRDLDAPRVDEMILGYEIEVAEDFTLALNVTRRERDRELWSPLYDVRDSSGNTLLGFSNFTMGTAYTGPVACDNGSSTTTGGASSCDLSQGRSFTVQPWMLTPATISSGATTTVRNRILTNRPGYTEDFDGVELTATKRLSNNWMLRGYFSWQDWTKSIDCTMTSADGICLAGPGVQNPANLVGDTNRDGSWVYIGGGTSSGGFANSYLGSASWTYNLNGMYQLPRNFTVSANLNGREGYALPLFLTLDESELDGITNRQGLQVLEGDSARLDDLHLVDLRLGYLIQLEGGTSVDLSLEIFNVFNDNTVLQYQRRQPCIDGDANGLCNQNGGLGADLPSTFRTAGNLGTIFETLSPQIFRLGARITFK